VRYRADDWLLQPPEPEPEPVPWRLVVLFLILGARGCQMFIADSERRGAELRAAEQAAQQEKRRKMFEHVHVVPSLLTTGASQGQEPDAAPAYGQEGAATSTTPEEEKQ